VRISSKSCAYLAKMLIFFDFHSHGQTLLSAGVTPAENALLTFCKAYDAQHSDKEAFVGRP